MSDDARRLDGNAAGGMLVELFGAEMTEAVITCGSCGARGAAGAAHVYAGGPGTVMRCTTCSSVLLRVARVRGRLVADLRGIAALEMEG